MLFRSSTRSCAFCVTCRLAVIPFLVTAPERVGGVQMRHDGLNPHSLCCGLRATPTTLVLVWAVYGRSIFFSSYSPLIMAGRLAFAAALVVCSIAPAIASEDPSTITVAPKPNRTPSYDLAKRQTTYETNSPLPLTQYKYPFSAIPEQVNPFAVGRGPQSGYNKCNSSTEGPTSQCQTIEVNSLVCLFVILI